MKYLKNIVFLLLAVFCISSAVPAEAGLLQPDASGDILDRAEDLGGSSGFNTDETIGGVVAVIISAFLGLLGIIFIILIIIAGFNWMTAGGEEEKIRKAKSTISRAVIGLIIIVAAYAVTYFVFDHIPGITGQSDYYGW